MGYPDLRLFDKLSVRAFNTKIYYLLNLTSNPYFRPGLSVSSMSSEVTVFSVQLMPNNPEQVLVGVKASQVSA